MYWIVQHWDAESQQYVDTDKNVYPGDTFAVLKQDAKMEVLPPEQQTEFVQNKYTVRLRAKYADKEQPTPTHIWWYNNYPNSSKANNTPDRLNTITASQEVVDQMAINEAVDIKSAPVAPTVPAGQPGYTFIGWARVTTSQSKSMEDGNTTNAGEVLNLSYSDVYLVGRIQTMT